MEVQIFFLNRSILSEGCPMLNIISNFYIFHVSRYHKRLLRNTEIYLNFIETKQYNFSKTYIFTIVQLTNILFSMRVKKMHERTFLEAFHVVTGFHENIEP